MIDIKRGRISAMTGSSITLLAIKTFPSKCEIYRTNTDYDKYTNILAGYIYMLLHVQLIMNMIGRASCAV